MRLPLLATFIALTAMPALADEVWSTPYGDIVYESDLPNAVAVLSAPREAMTGEIGGEPVTVHVLGMTANVVDRTGLFEGYWFAQGNTGYCETQMTAPGGKATNNWGRVRVYFDRPEFPTGFTMLVGTCFYDPYFVLRADPMAG
jgi:hypothetical protein